MYTLIINPFVNISLHTEIPRSGCRHPAWNDVGMGTRHSSYGPIAANTFADMIHPYVIRPPRLRVNSGECIRRHDSPLRHSSYGSIAANTFAGMIRPYYG